MIVRWLGAFGKGADLKSSLYWELAINHEEVAAEPLHGFYVKNGDLDYASSIDHAKVGLILKRSSLIKKFNGDCWSIKQDHKLVKTRNPRASTAHNEAWVRPDYVAIIIKGPISEGAFIIIEEMAAQFNLPILNNRGEIIKKTCSYRCFKKAKS